MILDSEINPSCEGKKEFELLLAEILVIHILTFFPMKENAPEIYLHYIKWKCSFCCNVESP